MIPNEDKDAIEEQLKALYSSADTNMRMLLNLAYNLGVKRGSSRDGDIGMSRSALTVVDGGDDAA